VNHWSAGAAAAVAAVKPANSAASPQVKSERLVNSVSGVCAVRELLTTSRMMSDFLIMGVT